MTTTMRAAAVVRLHEIYKVPPRFDVEATGPRCPVDDSQLRVRLSKRGVMQGWDCLLCRGAWNRAGSRSWWSTRPARRVPAARATCVVIGSATTASGIAGTLAGLGDHLVLAAAAVPAAATLAILAAAAVGRVRDWNRYRHNVIVRHHDGTDVLVGEVSDGA